MDHTPRHDTGELLAHARWVEELARRLIRDPSAADDLAQSAWVAALRTTSDPVTNVRAWWARVVRNLARESHRHDARRDALAREVARQTVANGDAALSGEELAARADAHTHVVEAVLALDAIHRDVLLRRYFEGLSPREIARREHLPLATITSRITRAHASLRARLERSDTSWLAALAPLSARVESPSVPVARWILMSTVAKSVAVFVVVAAITWWLIPKARERSEELAAAESAAHAAEPAPSAPLVEAPAESSARATAATTAHAEPEARAEIAPAATIDAPAAAPTAGVRIHGRVFRPDGEPAPGRAVRLLRTPGGPTKNVVSDVEGRFDERGLPAGKWNLSSSPKDDELEEMSEPTKSLAMIWLAQHTVEIADGAEVEVELGKPSPHPILVSGAFVGLPPSDTGILTWIPVGTLGQDRSRIGKVREGRFTHLLDEPGTYVVLVIAHGRQRFERVVEVPRASAFTCDFTLPSGELRGRVRAPDGAPVAKARVEVTCRAGIAPLRAATSFSWSQTTDAEGRFTFAGVEDGVYAVAVRDGKAADVVLGARCQRDVRVAADSTAEELDVVLEPGVIVRGTVRQTSQRGLNFTNVFVLDEHGEALNPLNGATTDKGGAFTLPALAPGRYTAVGARGDAWTQPVTFELRAGEAAPDVELVVGPAARIEIDGTGLEHAWIDVRDAAGNGFGALLDRNVFNGSFGRDCSTTSWSYYVPQGNYTIRALGRHGIVARAHVAAVEGETVRTGLAR